MNDYRETVLGKVFSFRPNFGVLKKFIVLVARLRSSKQGADAFDFL